MNLPTHRSVSASRAPAIVVIFCAIFAAIALGHMLARGDAPPVVSVPVPLIGSAPSAPLVGSATLAPPPGVVTWLATSVAQLAPQYPWATLLGALVVILRCTAKPLMALHDADHPAANAPLWYRALHILVDSLLSIKLDQVAPVPAARVAPPNNGSAASAPPSNNGAGAPPAPGGFVRLRLLGWLSIAGLAFAALLCGCANTGAAGGTPASPPDRVAYNGVVTIQAGEDATLAAWRVDWNIRWNANELAKAAAGYPATRAALINEADSVAFKAAAADKALAALIATTRAASSLPGDITQAATEAGAAAADLKSLIASLKAGH